MGLASFAGPVPVHAQPDGGAETRGSESEEKAQSQAERIMALRMLLSADRAWRDELQNDMRLVRRAYDKVSDGFAALSQELSRARQAQGEPEGPTAEDVSSLEAERDAARDRFDVLIQRRTALEKQLEVLQAKIAFEDSILENLVAGRPLMAVSEPAPGEAPSAPDREQTPAPTAPIPGLPPLPGLTGPAGPGPSPSAEVAPEVDDPIVDRSVLAARERLRKAEMDVALAEARIRLTDQAIALFDKDLESARELRSAAREVEAAARSELDTIREELEAARAVEPPDPRVASLTSKEEAAVRRLQSVRERLVRHDERIASSEAVVESVRRSRDRLVKGVESAREEAEDAQRHLAFVKSPFAPHRLFDWLRDSGPHILFIVGLMFAFRWFANVISRRFIGRVVGRARRGDAVARRERAETVGRVFRSSATIVILVAGLLAIFDRAGMDITVLLGGAAVFGAAVAFGSQSLIKDYFSGFMLLAENQYSVGNVIRIGSTSGVVEDINLRVTVLRDLEGIVHFIPHSQVSTVSNMTYGWSRALLDIGVAYKEDVNRVMQELLDIGRELRADEDFGPMILDDPEMLGVDAFGDSAVVIKFFIKTRPLMQWNVKREMLRRIKMRFDELGIEIPFPHRTVFHRTSGGVDAPPPPESALAR